MTLVTQSAAAHSVGIDPRTIRLWIQQGKLKRRRYKRVALEDVRRLVQTGRKATRHSRAGGYSGGRITYSGPGRPLGRTSSPWNSRLARDSKGWIYLWGQLYKSHAEMEALHTLTEIERSIEIRILAAMWQSIREGDQADTLRSELVALRSLHFISEYQPFRIEGDLLKVLKDTSPREIFVITARLVYDYVHTATRDMIPCDMTLRRITQKEQEELFQKARKDQSLSNSPEMPKLFDPTAPPNKRLQGEELDRKFIAWKAIKDQEFLKTKYGRRMSGLEPIRGVKRWYTLATFLGVSHRMASYWKKRTAKKYKEVIDELNRVTPKTISSQNKKSWEQSVEEMFEDHAQGEEFK